MGYVYIESTSKTATGVSFRAGDDRKARAEVERLSGRTNAPYVRLFRKEGRERVYIGTFQPMLNQWLSGNSPH